MSLFATFDSFPLTTYSKLAHQLCLLSRPRERERGEQTLPVLGARVVCCMYCFSSHTTVMNPALHRFKGERKIQSLAGQVLTKNSRTFIIKRKMGKEYWQTEVSAFGL